MTKNAGRAARRERGESGREWESGETRAKERPAELLRTRVGISVAKATGLWAAAIAGLKPGASTREEPHALGPDRAGVVEQEARGSSERCFASLSMTALRCVVALLLRDAALGADF